MTESAEEGSPQSARQTEDCLGGARKAISCLDQGRGSEIGEGGPYNPIANTLHTSTGYSLRAFGINCLGFKGNKREKETREPPLLALLRFPSAGRRTPVPADTPTWTPAAPRRLQAQRMDTGKGGGARQPDSPRRFAQTHTDGRTDRQPASSWRPVASHRGKRRKTPRALNGRTPAPQTHIPTHNHTHTR